MVIIKKSETLVSDLYPAPESNRHSFLSVFETDASTSSASWASKLYLLRYTCKSAIYRYIINGLQTYVFF